MLYKRPRFRRGGSTGIASLTPRQQYSSAGAVMPEMIGGRTLTPIEQERIRNFQLGRRAPGFSPMEQRLKSFGSRARGLGTRFLFNPKVLAGAALTSPFILQATLPDELKGVGGLFDAYGAYGGGMGAGAEIEPRIDRILAGRPEMEQTVQRPDELPVYDEEEEEGGAETINVSEIIEKVVPKPNVKPKLEDPKDTGEQSFEKDFQDEVSKLNRVLGKKAGVDKGEIALLVADAIGTKGSVADKAKTLSGLLRKKIATDKATDRQIALLAYKTVGDLRKAEIAAGRRTYSEKVGDRLRKLNTIINDPKSTPEQIKQAKREKEIELDSIPGRTADKLTDATSIKVQELLSKKINRLKLEKRKATPDENKIQGLLDEIEQLNRQLLPRLQRTPEGRLKNAEGGRAELAEGSPKPPAMEAPTPDEVSRTPSPQVSKLSYDELRNRLPKEITDDVVKLISGSEEALRDFAYIRTQGDVDKFNVKYGVTLVLPPTT